jgi:hypothetical protein
MNTTASSASARLSDRLPIATDSRAATPAGAAGTRRHYDPSSTLRQARTRYFEDNAFGADGGYSARWVEVKVGPFPYAIPNTEGRVRAVRYHDLHHIMTGYRTNWTGETEISAWELGSGCRDFRAAWFLNISALGLGVALAPRRLYRAFVRGRHSRNLYDRPFSDALLDARVGEMRAELGLDREPPPATVADKLSFAAHAVAGVVLDIAQIALMFVPFTIVGTALLVLRSNRSAGSAKM